MQPGTFNIIPKQLPIEFSLVVEDKHQTPSKNNEIVSVNVECPTSLQQTARDTRNNLFLKLINDERGSLLPQAVDNFKYFLSGQGDTVGNPTGVSGKGIPKPLPVSWLENRKPSQFADAQESLVKEIFLDILRLATHYE